MKKTLLMCVLSAFVGGLAVVLLNPFWRGGARGAQVAPGGGLQIDATLVDDRPAGTPEDLARLTPEERTNVQVYQSANKSVVNINTRSVRADFFFETLAEGAGSGCVLDKQGHVLTNYHVIEGAREIQVTLSDGNAYEAEPVGSDPNNDLAVLKIKAPAEALFPVTLVDSARLLVGQKVFAIGNPFGLDRTLSTGIVSSLNRSMRSRNGRVIRSIIQLDVDINPGNSGGPLLDSQGKMIGMNTAIATETGQSAGVGFAIPSSTIIRIVPLLIEHGRVIRADAGIAKVVPSEQGLLVAVLVPEGPAEQAGVQGFRVVREQRKQGPYIYERTRVDRSQADLIVAVDGQPVKTYDDLLEIVERHKPGETATLTVERGGRKVDVAVRLAESGN